MESVDFFTVVSGVFKNAQEAFDQAVKEARSVHGEGNTGTIAAKEFYRQIKVPRGRDPLAFAKEEASRHGNDFWNYCDGPAACVEVKGDWLKNVSLKKSKKARGFRVFVFFGQAYYQEKDILQSEEEKKRPFSI